MLVLAQPYLVLLMRVACQRIPSVLVFFIGLFFAGPAGAQGTDTLALAHRLTDGKEFSQAATLLARYEQAHPTSTDAVRLHLQLLYWQHQLAEADALYGRAIGQQPAATGLQLDYGRILYETKRVALAQQVLGALLQREPNNVEALTMLGIMQYNQGNLAKAADYLNQVLATYPDNPTARTFAQKIQAARAPYAQLYTTYRRDDQPLKWLETKVEAGSYHSALFSPSLQAALWNTQDSAGGFRQHLQVLAGNKSTLLNQQLTVQLSAGAFKHAAQSAPVFVGNATLAYKLLKGFSVEVSGSRSPYFYTIASSRTPVLTNQVVGALLFQRAKGWQGRAQVAEAFYPGNRLMGLSTWALSPALTLGPVYVKGGYSFAYADAQYNTYAPVLTTAQLAAAFGRPVAGTYGNYFTPSRQFIHSLLLNADAKAGRRCWLSLKGSVGVYAQVQNPYLFLNGDRATGLYVDKGYYPERYVPYDVKGQVSYALSAHATLEGGYVHTRSVFYTAGQAFANLKLTF